MDYILEDTESVLNFLHGMICDCEMSLFLKDNCFIIQQQSVTIPATYLQKILAKHKNKNYSDSE